MTRTLFSDPHLTLTHDPATGLVRYQRTREPYTSVEEVREVHVRLAALLPKLPPGDLKLLIDSREAPARNDEGFESEIQKVLAGLDPRFTARAILIKSAVGKLQVQRMERSTPGAKAPLAVFTSEDEALDHLGVPGSKR